MTELQASSAAARGTSGARLLLGDCYLRQGRFQDVVDLLAPWEASYGADRGFAYVLGSAFIETDRVDQGQRLIDTIFKGGESAEGHLLMGSVHLRAGDAPAALIELRKAVELNPHAAGRQRRCSAAHCSATAITKRRCARSCASWRSTPTTSTPTCRSAS